MQGLINLLPVLGLIGIVAFIISVPKRFPRCPPGEDGDTKGAE